MWNILFGLTPAQNYEFLGVVYGNPSDFEWS